MKEQELFWEEVKKIQDCVVHISLSKLSKYDGMDKLLNDMTYDTMEKILNDVTYDTIYSMMELLDGYRNRDLRGEVINKLTGCSINSNIDLHNYCEEHLNCSDV